MKPIKLTFWYYDTKHDRVELERQIKETVGSGATLNNLFPTKKEALTTEENDDPQPIRVELIVKKKEG